jgi:hypothetical protein
MAKQRKAPAKSLWSTLFSASHAEDMDTTPLTVQSGGTASSTPGAGASALPNGELGGMVEAQDGVKCSPDGNLLIRRMPIHRLEKYATLRAMGKDPTIDSALKMHISHALAANAETGEIISIDSKDGNDYEEIVEDLRTIFKPLLNANLEKWAYGACLMGWQPLRVYGEEGVGVTQVRHDYYTLPDFTSRFERVGNLAGFASSWQQLTGHERSKGLLRLMAPWSFVEIKLPNWQIDHFNREPHRHNGDVFSIDRDDWQSEGYIESQDYGTSLIETAFEPWVDLQEAILSLNMSRKNAANVERLIGVQTGKLNPQKAAEYLSTIGNQMRRASQAQAQQSLRKGYVQTVWNHIIPIFSAGQGQLDISTVEGRPDIAEIEDIKFHINRLGSAVGVEPALLGFGEQLSGGLGDGGFFRMSVMAAMKANMVRTAVESMIQRLFDIHVAYKYGKVFTEAERPWQVRFHSLNTAIAREQADESERQVQYATSVTSLMQMIDPMLGNVKINEFQNWLLTDLMKVDEEKANRILAEVKKADPEGQQADDGEIIGESVSQAKQDQLKTLIYEALAEMETAT